MARILTALADATLSVPPQAHIDFGTDALERLPEAIDGVGETRALVVTDPGLRATGIVDRVLDLCDKAGIATDVFDAVEANPSTTTIDRGADRARTFGRAAVVAVGGGSVLDAAKGIALLGTNDGLAADFDYRHSPKQPGLPMVAIPTTSGTGAETNGFGVIAGGSASGSVGKVYIGHDTVRPRRVLLDPELTVGLPPRVTAATGMDALVHGIESLASKGASELSIAYATHAVTLVSDSLRDAVADGTDLEARARLMMGSHLAGMALSLSGLGLVHGIAHSVTGHCGAAHGLALSSVLDEVMERSLTVAQAPYAVVARAMGLPTGADEEADARAAIDAVRELADSVDVRVQLSELGLGQESLPSVAQGALSDSVTSNHPRAFTQDEVEQILTARY